MLCSKLEVSTVQHGTLSGTGYLHQSRQNHPRGFFEVTAPPCANGRKPSPPRAASACPCHSHDAETSRGDSGRRLALLGRQGLDIGQASSRSSMRTGSAAARSGSTRLWSRSRRGRCAPSRVGAIMRPRTRRRTSTRPNPALQPCRKRFAGSLPGLGCCDLESAALAPLNSR